MQRNVARQISGLYLSGVLLTAALSAVAATPDMHLTGLAVHQDTGRNIYLGGIFFDKHVPKPNDLVKAAGPKLMEYRVVARRTSIRSLVGGIVLQSELASGLPPAPAVTQFASNILSSVKGSLYEGDSFEILLTEQDQTVAYLNGHELARARDGTVADYLLLGWVGERGPSKAFRDSILAEEIDPALLLTFRASVISPARKREVASWFYSAADSPESAPQDANEPVGAQEFALTEVQTADMTGLTAASTITPRDNGNHAIIPVSAAALETTLSGKAEPLLKIPGAHTGQTWQKVGDNPATTQLQGSQVATLVPAADLLKQEVPDEADVLSITDYSQRLAQFNTHLIKMVYSAIHYPNQAVRRGLQGRLELDITLREDGGLVGVAIAQSSGYKILDKAAVKAARKALSSGKLEAVDPVAVAEYAADGDQLVVPVPVQFLLTE